MVERVEVGVLGAMKEKRDESRLEVEMEDWESRLELMMGF